MTAIVILAAGSSSRMGKPKQILELSNKTMLNRIIKVAGSVSDNLVVVLGANSELVRSTINQTNLDVQYNENWNSGISSSIKVAVLHVQMNYPVVDRILFVLCDQPFVNKELLQVIISTAVISNKGIVACNYNNTIGVPALFKKTYFQALLNLSCNEGAKTILSQQRHDVYTIPFLWGILILIRKMISNV